ncbi:MAG: hypothetical protein WA865_08310, partial [Spirulinaceae cyanobacterium]
MTTIRIIHPTPGPTTTEKILTLIQSHPQGLTLQEVSQILNRPISMTLHCLKPLIASKKVYSQLNHSKMRQIYYPSRCKLKT